MKLFLSETEKLAQAVCERVPNAKNIRCVDIKRNFLKGELYTFAFELEDISGAEKSFTSRVYCYDGDIEIYGNDEILLAVVGATHKKGEPLRLSIDTVAGFIAISLTLCIIYLSIFHQGEYKIPDILSNALTVILGFYFGKASQAQTPASKNWALEQKER